jgi:hypothetical protein
MNSFIYDNYIVLLKLYLKDNGIGDYSNITVKYDNDNSMFIIENWQYTFSQPTIADLEAIDPSRINTIILENIYKKNRKSTPIYSASTISQLTNSSVVNTGDLVINSDTGRIQVYVNGSWIDNSNFQASVGNIDNSSIGTLKLKRLQNENDSTPSLNFQVGVSGTIVGTDLSGNIELVVSGSNTITQCEVVFRTPYTNVPTVQLMAGNYNSANIRVYVETTTTSFVIRYTEIPINNTYKWSYMVIGT